ncbi:MAG TPA: hypothetical protein ENF81_08335, partial [Thermotogaceae bacterium]|nr:hypothetical protein [Thermotogaceae bacterium]
MYKELEIKRWAKLLKEETYLKGDSTWVLLVWDWDYMDFTIDFIPKGLAPMDERKRLKGNQILVKIDYDDAKHISKKDLMKFIERQILRFTKELARAVYLYRKHTGEPVVGSDIDLINELFVAEQGKDIN